MNYNIRSILITIFMLSVVLVYGQQYNIPAIDTIKRTFTNPLYKGDDPWVVNGFEEHGPDPLFTGEIKE